MADGIDISKILDDPSKALELYNKAADAVTKFGDTGKYGAEAMDTLSKGMEKAQNIANKTMGVLVEAFDNPNQYLKNLSISSEMLSRTISNLVTPTNAAKVALVAMSAFDGFTPLADEVKSLDYDLTGMGKKISNIPGLLSGLPGGAVFKPIANILNVAQPMKNFENRLLSAAAAGGQLNDIFDQTGKNLERMDDKLFQIADYTRKVGDATGFTSGKVTEWYMELQKMPGVLEDSSTGIVDVETQMEHLEDAVMVSRGSMKGMSEVIKFNKEMYDQLGMTISETLPIFSKIHTTTTDLRMPFEHVMSFTKNASLQFKFLGDNANGAMNVLAKMQPALKGYGLGPQAITELVGNFTKGIADLDMAQRAFLSAQTGGPGGLQGAFAIDLELKEGGLEAVAEKAQQALMKQFGGRIVTLEEAAGSESAAAQMAKQIQILTSGPLKVASDENQAKALIEAMARGGNIGEALRSPQEAMNDTIQKGNVVRNRQYDVMTKINNKLEYIGQMQAITAYQLTRSTVGAERPGAPGAMRLSSDYLQKQIILASREAGAVKLGTKQGLRPSDELIGREIDQTLEFIKELPDLIGLKKRATTKIDEQQNVVEETTNVEARQKAIAEEIRKRQTTGIIQQTPRFNLENVLQAEQERMGKALTASSVQAAQPNKHVDVEVRCIDCQEKLFATKDYVKQTAAEQAVGAVNKTKASRANGDYW